MERRRRLSNDKRLRLIEEAGGRWYNPWLGLKALPNPDAASRYAFRVGKHLGKAVERNRIKRLMREAVRLSVVGEGWDLIFSARAGAKASNLWQIKRALEGILARARVPMAQKGSAEPKERKGR